MISEKNRFKTHEKLWNLDDKQLSSPIHDALVLWLMEEENAKKVLTHLENPIIEHGFINPARLDTCFFSIRSEIPFQAKNGFINAYGDLEITRTETIKEKYYECHISEETLSLIDEAKTVGDIMDILKTKFLVTDFKPCLNGKYYRKRFPVQTSIDGVKHFDYEEKDLEEWEYRETGYFDDTPLRDLKLKDFVMNFTGIPIDMSIFDVEDWIKENNYYRWRTNHIKCLIEVKPTIDSFGQTLRQINSYKVFWNPRSYSNVQLFVCLFTLDDTFDSQFESQGIKVLHPPSDFNIDDVMEHYGLR